MQSKFRVLATFDGASACGSGNFTDRIGSILIESCVYHLLSMEFLPLHGSLGSSTHPLSIASFEVCLRFLHINVFMPFSHAQGLSHTL